MLGLSPRERFLAIPRYRITTRFPRRLYTSSAVMAAEQPQAADQLVQHDGREYRAVKEGLAFILNPPPKSAAPQGTKKDTKPDNEVQAVFYNPIQQFNRDLSVLAIRAYGEHVLALKKQRAEERRRKMAQSASKKGMKRKREEENGDGGQEQKHGQEEVQQQEDKVTENGNGEQQQPASESHPEQNTPPSFTILDALSATGLRALRYASEIPFSTCVVANDLSPSAIQSMKTNVEYNGLGEKIRPNIGDARAYMYSCLDSASTNSQGNRIGKFDVVDLDPYGTAAPFLDAAVQGAKDGGLLCVTCTDAGVWASNGYPEKSFALYGGVPIKGGHSHEGGLRLILHALATSGAKYGLAIEPLLSLSIDFYARVFVRVHRSPAEVKFTAGNMMLVYNCDSGCGAWETQPLSATKQKLDKKGNPFYHYGFAQGPTASPLCSQCGIKTHLAGPMWAGPLHNPQFIQKILAMLPGADKEIYQTTDRIEGMLTTALEEDLDLVSSADGGSTSEAVNKEEEEKKTNEPPEFSAIIPRTDPVAREPYPFYMNLSYLSKVLHTSTMPVDAFRGSLRHLGYRSTRSHAKPNSIRTDAPWEVIWEIMREWVRQKSPIKENALSPTSAGAAIMAKSRENLRKSNEDDQLLASLKSEILSAVESGKDASDLVTKVEAALYRSGSRQTLGQGIESQQGKSVQQLTTADSSAKGPHPSSLEIVFDEALGREASAAHTKKRLVRYQVNPRANWGPLSRASAN